jgi:hypothetical protein
MSWDASERVIGASYDDFSVLVWDVELQQGINALRDAQY